MLFTVAFYAVLVLFVTAVLLLAFATINVGYSLFLFAESIEEASQHDTGSTPATPAACPVLRRSEDCTVNEDTESPCDNAQILLPDDVCLATSSTLNGIFLYFEHCLRQCD